MKRFLLGLAFARDNEHAVAEHQLRMQWRESRRISNNSEIKAECLHILLCQENISNWED